MSMDSKVPSLSSHIRLASDIHGAIKAEIARRQAAPEEKLSPEEGAAREAAFKETQGHLRNTMATVDLALNALNSTRKKRAAKLRALAASRPKPLLRAVRAVRARASGGGGVPVAACDAVKEGMLTGLKGPADTLVQLAQKTAPIMDNYVALQKLPYLEGFNASLNAVPLIGLKDNKTVMYLQISAPPGSDELLQSWTTFGSLPTDAPEIKDQTVFFFPFHGDFYMSIGSSVWYKAHRLEGDPELTKAIDNMPRMYQDAWTKVGDDCFGNNLRGITPLTYVSADGQTTDWNLVTLTADFKLLSLKGSTLKGSGNEYQELKFLPHKEDGKPDQTPPQLQRLAYATGMLWGHDGTNIWQLDVKVTEGTWAAAPAQMVVDDPVQQFAGNEKGVTEVKADNFLYQRIADVTDPDKPKFEWKKGIDSTGIAHIGVASPGTVLNLRVVTNYLRSRYLDTQAVLYPIANSIHGFAVTHDFYLGQLLETAKQWKNAPDEKKKEEAIAAGRGFFDHANVWTSLVSPGVTAAKQKVNDMSKQLGDIHDQIWGQLQQLKITLAGLNTTLDQQKTTLKAFQIAFWSMVGLIFLTIIIVIVGLATGVAAPLFYIGAGLLFVAGMGAMIGTGIKMGEAAAAVATTEGKISAANLAIDQLTTIYNLYDSLFGQYEILNQFWGRMANNLNDIKVMDEATAMYLGVSVLSDTSSIQASILTSKQLAEGTQEYLDVLNKFINPPSPSPSPSAVVVRRDAKTVPVRPRSMLALVSIPLTDSWYNVGELRRNDTIWSQSYSQFAVSKLSQAEFLPGTNILLFQQQASSNGGPLDSAITVVKPTVIASVQSVIALTSILTEWQRKFPDAKSAQSNTKEVANLRDRSLKACRDASAASSTAAEAFIGFNRVATDYSNKLHQQKGAANDKINQAEITLKSELDETPPWYVYIGGAAAVTIWYAAHRSDAQKEYNNTVNAVKNILSSLDSQLQSGVVFDGEALNWDTMVQHVSQLIGATYNQLFALEGQVLENPVFYSALIGQEWATIQRDANDVLLMVNQTGVRAARTLRSDRKGAPLADVKDSASSLDGASLAQIVSVLTESTASILSNLTAASRLAYAPDLVAYWTADSKTRVSISRGSSSLRYEYLEVLRLGYDTMQNLSAFSVMEEHRGKALVARELPAGDFLTATKNGLNGVRSAAETGFADVASHHEITRFVTDMKANVAGVVTGLAKFDQQKKMTPALITELADLITAVFADGSYAVTLGFPKKVANTLVTLSTAGADFATTSSSIAGVLHDLKPSSITAVLRGLHQTVEKLNEAVALFSKAAECEDKAVTAGATLLPEVVRIQDAATDHLSSKASFPQSDLEASWGACKVATVKWLDTVNAQGV